MGLRFCSAQQWRVRIRSRPREHCRGMVACPPNGVDSFAAFNGNGAVFQDNVQSYSTVEPAIDLTASSFLGFAWEIAGAPSGTP